MLELAQVKPMYNDEYPELPHTQFMKVLYHSGNQTYVQLPDGTEKVFMTNKLYVREFDEDFWESIIDGRYYQ